MPSISVAHRQPLMLLAVVVASVSVGAGRATPPHIVHIMADDTGVRTTSGDRSGPGWLGLAGLVLTLLRAAGLCGTVERPGLQEQHDPLAQPRQARHRGRPAHLPLCAAATPLLTAC